MPSYSILDKLLHKLALGLGSVAEMSFDIDQKLTVPDSASAAHGAHIFVAGLARAGTTVLMRHLYASGEFSSLTYRDMPFVLAPNLWSKLNGSKGRQVKADQRAHGDNLLVDADSPESLDEVFWRIFASEEYIRNDCLIPHRPRADLRAKFASYIGAILARSGKTRYLSKNNNNILRLGTLHETFPQALIVIPFRAPASHAESLLNQHRHFSQMQHADPFVRRYMTWLVHHEFGGDHRPFVFDGARPVGDLESLNYWVDLWIKTYTWVIEHAPSNAVFVCYEALCTDPGIWTKLASMAGIDPATEADGGFQLSRARPESSIAITQVPKTDALYDRLTARARMDLELG